MATFVIMVIRLQVIFMFLKCADCQMLSTCLLPIYNQECDLNCTTADQLKLISFYKLPDGTNPIGQCLGINCQISNVSLTSKYSIQSTDSTTTTFRINELSWDEKGTWRCDYDNTPDTTDLGFAKFPDDIEYSGLSNNSDIESGTVMPITMKCLYTEIPTLVTLIYQSTGGTARSIPVTCTDTTSSCANNNFVSKLCMPIIQVGTGVVCDGNYSIEIATSVLGNEERKYSLLNGITIKCKVSREVRKLSITVTEAGKKSVPWNIGVAVVLPIVAGIIYSLYKVTIVTTIAELWLFSNQYMFYGSVVYGIQLVIVSAVSDIMNILTAVGVLLYYSGQYIVMTVSVCLFLLFLVTLFSIAGVGIFILIVSFCGEKEKIHIKLKEKEESKKLSTHGIKLKKNTPALFNFKVKARKDAYITLHGIARSSDCQDKDDIEIQIVLGCGSPSRSVASEHILDESNGACLCNVLSHNKYCSFYLACENNSITVMDGKKKTILQWTVSVDNFEMRDITISDIKRDDSKKDGSTKGYSTKDDSTKGYSTKDDSTKNKQGEKPETSAEWIFLFRKGDSLCEIEEHEREIKEDSRFKQTVQLICVIIFPIAWLVVGVLVVIYLLKSKGKNTDNTDSELGVKLNQNQKELSEQQIKNQNG